MPIRRQTRRTRVTRTQTRAAWKIGSEHRAKIVREAKSLGMSANEYMRLMLTLSSTLRENLHLDAGLKPKDLLKLVENPMFSMLIQWLAKNALSTIKEQADVSPTVPTPEPSSPDAPQSVPPQGHQPPWNMYPYSPPQLAPGRQIPQALPATPQPWQYW